VQVEYRRPEHKFLGPGREGSQLLIGIGGHYTVEQKGVQRGRGRGCRRKRVARDDCIESRRTEHQRMNRVAERGCQRFREFYCKRASEFVVAGNDGVAAL
jgi:hypothetical protein